MATCGTVTAGATESATGDDISCHAEQQEMAIGSLLLNSSADFEQVLNSTLFRRTPIKSILSDISRNLNVFVLPFVILLGIVGNTLSLLVFRSAAMSRQTTSVYLASLACSDTGFLLCLFIAWLSWLKIEIFHRHFWCVVVVYFSYVCGFLSVWLVVAFTVERFLCVCCPFRQRRIASRKRAKIVVCLLTIFSLGAYSFATWTSGIIVVNKRQVCAPYPWQFRVLSILTHVDTAVTLVLPSLLIITLNTGIVWMIYRFQVRTSAPESRALAEPPRPVNPFPSEALIREPRGQIMEGRLPTAVVVRDGRQQTRLKSTRILLAVSTVFLLLNLPSHALRVRICILEFTQPDHRPTHSEIQYRQIAEFIYYLNFTLNVFLYSLCGEHFRRSLGVILNDLKKNFVKCLCHAPPAPTGGRWDDV